MTKHRYDCVADHGEREVRCRAEKGRNDALQAEPVAAPNGSRQWGGPSMRAGQVRLTDAKDGSRGKGRGASRTKRATSETVVRAGHFARAADSSADCRKVSLR